MEKLNLKKILSVVVALGIPITMSGCSSKETCDIPVRHVHLYKRSFSDSIIVNKYLDSEMTVYHGYERTPEYIEITKDDESFYKTISGLYNGEKNWPYLFSLMKSKKDFLEFYYEYLTVETYTTIDSDGKTKVHTRMKRHGDWHTDPYDDDNTGKVRVGHYKYHGYNVIKKDGKYTRIQSTSVDDVRDIIYDYPYYEDDPTDLVYSYHDCKKSDLPKLTPEDFENDFDHPRLDIFDIDINKTDKTSNNDKVYIKK